MEILIYVWKWPFVVMQNTFDKYYIHWQLGRCINLTECNKWFLFIDLMLSFIFLQLIKYICIWYHMVSNDMQSIVCGVPKEGNLKENQLLLYGSQTKITHKLWRKVISWFSKRQVGSSSRNLYLRTIKHFSPLLWGVAHYMFG